MSGIDDFQALLGVPVTPVQRRRQQASQARFDRAVGLVEQAARAAGTGDQAALDGLVARMDQVAFDDFEQCHPPSAALNYLLYEVVCDLVPADQDLPAGPGRWVRLAVGLAAEEYQLGNAELEAIERVRGGVGADRDSSLVTWLAQVDRRPRAALLGDGVVALVWLRAFTW